MLMNYREHYRRLIKRARNRVLEGYSERHHVKPRCLGGEDKLRNIIRLTPEEHYVGHQLLVKMYPGNTSLVHAAWMMSTNQNGMRSNKYYGWLRRLHSKAMSDRVISADTRMRMSVAQRGRILSDEHRAKLKASHKGMAGKKQSPEHRANWSASRMGHSVSKETRAKISATKKGIPWSVARRTAQENRRLCVGF